MPIESQREEWKQAVLDWMKTEKGREYLNTEFELSPDQIQFLESPENACDRPNPSDPEFTTSLSENLQLFAGIYPVQVTFSSEYPVRSIDIYVNDEFYRSIDVNDKTSGTYSGEFAVARTEGNSQKVTISVVDKYGYSSTKEYEVELLDRDTIPPEIQSDVESPLTVSIGAPVTISGTVTDANDISKITFFLDGKLYGTVFDEKTYSITLDSISELGLGEHEIIVAAQDFQGNEGFEKINVIVE